MKRSTWCRLRLVAGCVLLGIAFSSLVVMFVVGVVMLWITNLLAGAAMCTWLACLAGGAILLSIDKD